MLKCLKEAPNQYKITRASCVLYLSIIAVYDDAMSKVSIGVMGARGSFSEEAGHFYAKKIGLIDYGLEYLVSAENVLTAVQEGKVDKGIFPIENSNGGIVIEAVHAMAGHLFTIETMFEIDVHHNLLVKKGVTADSITKITSHDQAIKQCRMYLKRKWPSVEIEVYIDTATAAKDLAEGRLPETVAVIAPKICAELYDLDILEESIQDLKFNYTSFVTAVRREDV